MKKPPDPHDRHRFPAELIRRAVWLYHVFSLSFRDVERLWAESDRCPGLQSVERGGLTTGQLENGASRIACYRNCHNPMGLLTGGMVKWMFGMPLL
jgi:hypothetical protein